MGLLVLNQHDAWCMLPEFQVARCHNRMWRISIVVSQSVVSPSSTSCRISTFLDEKHQHTF